MGFKDDINDDDFDDEVDAFQATKIFFLVNYKL